MIIGTPPKKKNEKETKLENALRGLRGLNFSKEHKERSQLEVYRYAGKGDGAWVGALLEIDSAKSPFEQYVFFGDNKLAHACRFAKDDKIEINLQGLFSKSCVG